MSNTKNCRYPACIKNVADQLRELIAAAPHPAGEPVAWLVTSKTGLVRCAWTEEPDEMRRAVCAADGDTITLLYAAPQPVRVALTAEPGAPRAPLTLDQVKAMMVEAGYELESPFFRAAFIDGIRHGERAHGIGQEGAA